MPDYIDQIKTFEEEISATKYNKRTQHHIGLVKAKIARLREAHEKRISGGKKGEGYALRKSGDATAVLVGFPSTGKSTLLNALTGASSAVAAYDFTTLDVIPGMLEYKHAKIQLLDVPGIVHGAASGRGRGREVLAVLRNANLAILILDVQHPEHLPALLKEVRDASLRLNEEPPVVKIIRKSRGGLSIASTLKLTHLDERTIRDIFAEFRIMNADVVIRTNITDDQLIDAIEGNKVYLPAIRVLNKIDLISPAHLAALQRTLAPDICVSGEKQTGVEALKEMIFQRLRLMHVYCKEVGKPADLDVPMILRSGSTIRQMCERLHRDFVAKFRFARVWGSSKFPGQKLSLSYHLQDGDVVEIHLR